MVRAAGPLLGGDWAGRAGQGGRAGSVVWEACQASCVGLWFRGLCACLRRLPCCRCVAASRTSFSLDPGRRVHLRPSTDDRAAAGRRGRRPDPLAARRPAVPAAAAATAAPQDCCRVEGRHPAARWLVVVRRQGAGVAPAVARAACLGMVRLAPWAFGLAARPEQAQAPQALRVVGPDPSARVQWGLVLADWVFQRVQIRLLVSGSRLPPLRWSTSPLTAQAESDLCRAEPRTAFSVLEVEASTGSYLVVPRHRGAAVTRSLLSDTGGYTPTRGPVAWEPFPRQLRRGCRPGALHTYIVGRPRRHAHAGGRSRS